MHARLLKTRLPVQQKAQPNERTVWPSVSTVYSVAEEKTSMMAMGESRKEGGKVGENNTQGDFECEQRFGREWERKGRKRERNWGRIGGR